MARKKVEIWTLDCETDPFAQGRQTLVPFLWGAYLLSADRYETFGHARTVLDFFRERRAIVYAHNGGKFDFHFMREGFDSDQPILCINSRITKFRAGLCEYRDSYALIPVPLASYHKEEIDYGIFEVGARDEPANRARIETYLKSDCVNLAAMLHDYFSRYGRGLTQAGSAMNVWIRKFNDGKKPRQSRSQFERFKPFYYGGRVECFVAGYKETDFKVVDKNSAYPDAMMRRHPISPGGTMLTGRHIPNDYEDCLVCVRAVSDGALPFRQPTGELSFPRDREARDYWCTGWELKAGLDTGRVKLLKFHEAWHFSEYVDFAGYITHFYNARREAQKAGDRAGDLFNKLFMNSCYGKFASDPSHYHDYVLASPEKYDDWIMDGFKPYQPWGDGRWLLWRALPEERQHYYNIATAASITGYVRAQLLRDLSTAGDLLYCDTDSIAAKSVAGLQMGTELGKWKMELECDAYAIAGKKMYAFRSSTDLYKVAKGEYKVACKGVDLTPAEIIKVSQGGEFLYKPEVPTFSISRPSSRLINRSVRMTAKVQ